MPCCQCIVQCVVVNRHLLAISSHTMCVTISRRSPVFGRPFISARCIPVNNSQSWQVRQIGQPPRLSRDSPAFRFFTRCVRLKHNQGWRSYCVQFNQSINQSINQYILFLFSSTADPWGRGTRPDCISTSLCLLRMLTIECRLEEHKNT